jgi:plasmid stability protein
VANDATIDSNAIIEYIAITAIKREPVMSSLTVRNIPEDAKLRFRQVAAAHGRSMEEHLRQLVITAGLEQGPEIEGVREVSQKFRHEPLKTASKAESRARIERLIALGQGLDFDPPPREVADLREVDFG